MYSQLLLIRIVISLSLGFTVGVVNYYLINKRIKKKLQVSKTSRKNNIGLLVGKMEGGRIEDCYASGTIRVEGSDYNTNVGIIGSASGDCEIKNVRGNVKVNYTKKPLTILERHPILTSFFVGVASSIFATILLEAIL